jgi:hypothetical protein
MAENNHCRFLALDTPDALQDDIVNSPPTLHEFERGRKLWIYDETPQVIEYTKNILKMVGTDAFWGEHEELLSTQDPLSVKYRVPLHVLVDLV